VEAAALAFAQSAIGLATSTIAAARAFGFDAATNANIAVAIGTICLAAVTSWLALETRRVVTKTQAEVNATTQAVESGRTQAKAAQDQVRLTLEASDRAIRPLLVEPTAVRFEPQRLVSFAIGPAVTVPDSGRIWHHAADGLVRVAIMVRSVGPGTALIRSCRVRDPPGPRGR
jgi:hypothetical protein